MGFTCKGPALGQVFFGAVRVMNGKTVSIPGSMANLIDAMVAFVIK
jgi:hypothetical protein